METTEHIHVLIADDSTFIRAYLIELLRADPQIEVVGTAATGDDVVMLARDLRPDVITMDYNMPGKNGVEATAAIMLGDQPLPGIIMLSAFEGEEGARVRAMLESSGAHVVAKPSGEVALDIEKVAAELVRKIKEVGVAQLNIRSSNSAILPANPPPSSFQRPTASSEALRGVVIIGASTGGPPLVEHLLSLLRPEWGIAVIVVQHMSKYFTELFAGRLDRIVRFSVREAKDGDTFIPGAALVLPGGFAISGFVDTPAGEQSHGTTPQFVLSESTNHAEDEINRTMESVASHFHGPLFGILLSGMGKDGSEGLRVIKSHGGHTLVQDPKTAMIASMPEHALHEGFVDAVLPIEAIPEWVSKILRGEG